MARLEGPCERAKRVAGAPANQPFQNGDGKWGIRKQYMKYRRLGLECN